MVVQELGERARGRGPSGFGRSARRARAGYSWHGPFGCLVRVLCAPAPALRGGACGGRARRGSLSASIAVALDSGAAGSQRASRRGSRQLAPPSISISAGTTADADHDWRRAAPSRRSPTPNSFVGPYAASTNEPKTTDHDRGSCGDRADLCRQAAATARGCHAAAAIPRGCGTAGTPRSPSRVRTGSRTSSAAGMGRSASSVPTPEQRSCPNPTGTRPTSTP